jgi:hypothetical protein
MSDSARRWSVMAKAPHARAMLTRAAPGLIERPDEQIEQRRVRFQLLPIDAMDGQQHALQLVVGRIGAVRRLAQARLQRAQPGRRHFLEQGLLGREIAIDIGMRHVGFLRDADDGRARRAELSQMGASDFEEARLDRFSR